MKCQGAMQTGRCFGAWLAIPVTAASWIWLDNIAINSSENGERVDFRESCDHYIAVG
jgi:hypothetical protein